MVLAPTQAMAAFHLLDCDDAGGVKPNTELFYDQASDSHSFCGQTGNNRIFSNVICNFINILNEVLGRVYCGLQHTLSTYVAMAITVYIIIFGAQILMGTTQLSSKEMVIRLLKVALVWTFVSQATWGVNTLFVFFVDFANQGIWWTLGSIRDASGHTIASTMGLTHTGDITSAVPVYVYIDQLIYQAVSGPFVQMNSKVMVFFAALAYLFPPIFMIAAYWLWTTFTILARTLISFVMSLSAIAFLICLSPIFFCFILFQSTMNFFETWLKYMMSFSLQVVLVFACVAMWIMAMSNFIGFFNQLSDVIFTDFDFKRITQIAIDEKSIGICPYKVTAGTAGGPSGTLIGPNVKCYRTGFNPYALGSDGKPTEQAAKDKDMLIDLGNQRPADDATTPEGKANPACSGSQLPEGATQCTLNRLNYFVIYHLITLIIIAYTFDALLKQAPYIAKELAGPQYVPILGKGFGGLGYGKMPSMSGRGRKNAGRGADDAAPGSASRQVSEQQSRLVGNRSTIGESPAET